MADQANEVNLSADQPQSPLLIPRLSDLVSPRRSAVLIVDVQRHFLGHGVAVGVQSFLVCLERLISHARSVAVPCIFIRAIETRDGNTAVWISRHATKPERLGNRDGTQASEFHPRIQPKPGDLVITKLRYSAFLGTDLESHLRSQGIDSLIIAGVQSDVCVRLTAADAFQRDFWTLTVADCTTTRSAQDQKHAMRDAAQNWGLVVDSADIVTSWKALQQDHTGRDTG